MEKVFDKPLNVFNIIFKGTLLYLKKFVPLSKPMLFPVFGQLAGIALLLIPSYLFSKNIYNLINSYEFLNNPLILFSIMLFLLLPGFFIFTTAVWKYLVEMVALNLPITNVLTGNTQIIDIDKDGLNGREKDYVAIWTIFSLMWLLGLGLPTIILIVNPLLFSGLEFIALLILLILSVYFCLTFQVFAFEKHTPFMTLKRSFELVKGNFWRTAIMSFLLIIVTQNIIPQIIDSFMQLTGMFSQLVKPFEIYISNIVTEPEQMGMLISRLNGNTADPVLQLSQITASFLLSMSVTTFLLPYSTACYTILYHDIIFRKNQIDLLCSNAKNVIL